MNLEATVSALWILWLSFTHIAGEVLSGAWVIYSGFSWWIGFLLLTFVVLGLLKGVTAEFSFYSRKAPRPSDYAIEESDNQLKCVPSYFAYIWDRSKPFEVRKNDRLFEVGDRYFLREWKSGKEGLYTGRWVEVEITYILSLSDFLEERGIDFNPLQSNEWVVFGFAELARSDDIQELEPLEDEPRVMLA